MQTNSAQYIRREGVIEACSRGSGCSSSSGAAAGTSAGMLGCVRRGGWWDGLGEWVQREQRFTVPALHIAMAGRQTNQACEGEGGDTVYTVPNPTYNRRSATPNTTSCSRKHT